jgi:Ca2+-transporting ATPase
MIIFLAVIFGFNLPLTALLLLWINMVTDGAPALAFGVDPYGKNIMKRKPIPSKQGILPSDKLWLIGTLGFVGTIIGLYIFNAYGGNTGDTAPMIAQTMIFNFIVILELILIFIIRKQYNIKQFTNWWLWFSMILTIFLQALIMYTPLSKVFGVVPLYAIDITILIISGLEFFAIYLIYHYLLKLKQTKIFANLIKS